ncbi:MAG: hypothetical protein QOF42_1104 [Gammaproteobacteria bacterium]|nr:hypothetical protein [Gammaproteobacteria bacterium]
MRLDATGSRRANQRWSGVDDPGICCSAHEVYERMYEQAYHDVGDWFNAGGASGRM